MLDHKRILRSARLVAKSILVLADIQTDAAKARRADLRGGVPFGQIAQILPRAFLTWINVKNDGKDRL
jgi:hypothetical protein